MGVSRMIAININKAKDIAHNIRRAKRSEEFAPLDIQATIPSQVESAEASRQAIRDKYATMQIAVDAAQSVDQIKEALEG
jgi:hypothetical protein